jgi:hypothetical protein
VRSTSHNFKVGDAVTYRGIEEALWGQSGEIVGFVSGHVVEVAFGTGVYNVFASDLIYMGDTVQLPKNDSYTLEIDEEGLTHTDTRECECGVISNDPVYDHLHTKDCPRYTKSKEYV